MICGTELNQDPQRQLQFELFYRSFVTGPEKAATGIDTLPVVVHIVHDGHPLGSDENPDDASILQKIAETNDRFRHINQVNGPNPFGNADTEIMLCLADEDPNGFFTKGILRYDDSLTFRQPGMELVNFIQNHKWDTDKYLNIFFIRYMPGLLGVYYGGNIDAVVLRSTTSDWLLAHETGHYLSLRHTFQGACPNDDCLAEGDLVCDTPPKAFAGLTGSCGNPGNSCTTDEDDLSANNPYRPIANGGLGDQPDLHQNYMDYTEGCGGSFTEGQKTRMKASIAAIRQNVVANAAVACGNNYTPATDAAVVDLVPNDTVCLGSFLPEVKIRNNGTANLTSANLEFYLGGSLVHSQPWSGNLATGAEAWVAAGVPVSIAGGRKKLSVVVTSPNGLTDEFDNDNEMSRYVAFYGDGVALPYTEAFAEFFFPEKWKVENSAMRWQMNGYFVLDTCQSDNRLLAAVSGGQGMPHSATLELPPLDLTAYSGAALTFDYGYLPYSAAFPDTFRIEVVTACGLPVVIWEKTGLDLATNDPPNYGNAYRYPECADMDSISLDLSAFSCQAQLSLRFTVSGYGYTPLILDKIKVTPAAPCVPPGCTYLTVPLANSANALPDDTLVWNHLGPGFDGYLLSVGLSPGGTEILDNFDVGNVSGFDPPGLFPCNTEVFVTISPYTTAGPTAGCPEESFQTFESIATACEPSFLSREIADPFDNPRAAAAADFDQDGDTDVVACSQSGNLTWWENDGSQNFTEHLLDANFGGGTSIETVDLDDDGDPDILAPSRFANQVAWWENLGGDNFTKRLVDGFLGEAQMAHAADVDGDGDLDVVANSRATNEINWYENDGSENFTEHFVDASLLGCMSTLPADVDGDGDMDIVGAGEIVDEVAWYENDGSENFTKHTVDMALDGATHVFAADVNGDGELDLLASAVVAGDVVWYENDGQENFTKHIVDAALSSASGIFAGDIDLDGDVDIFGSAYSSTNLAWYENDGQENFTKNPLLMNTSQVVTLSMADIDSDGVEDLLVPQNNGDRIVWLENSCDAAITTYLTHPEDGAVEVPFDVSIEWYAHPGASGYWLAVGMTPGGEEIVGFQDVGNVSSYDPAADLPANTVIFVTLVPYNGAGDFLSCSQGQFTTKTCTPNLFVAGDPVPGGDYFSDGELVAQGASVAGFSAVSFFSNSGIRLEGEFSVESGAVFTAEIQPCPGD